jgi:acetolactate synthase-1/3 small subunit
VEENHLHQIYSVLVENRSGVLSRIAGLFSRRGFNIDSLAVGVTETDDISRMTIVTDTDTESPERIFEQIRKQLSKMIDTIRVKALTPEACVTRELILIKLTGNPADVRAVIPPNAAVIDETAESVTLQIADTAERIDNALEALSAFEILETARTGVISLQKGRATLMGY